jgi:hypothetical protein
MANSSGNLDILVLYGADCGGPFDETTHRSGFFGVNETVIDECYATPFCIAGIFGSADAWEGSVMYSVDGGVMFGPLNCPTCTGGTTTTESIEVHGGAVTTGLSTTQCLDGSPGCSLYVDAPSASPTASPTTAAPSTGAPSASPTVTKPYCVSAVTGPAAGNEGGMDLLVVYGACSGADHTHRTGTYTLGETVLDECYATPVCHVVVHGSNSDEWTGSITYSQNSGAWYDPFECSGGGCTGSTTSTANIVLSQTTSGASQATTQCLNGGTGNVCHLYFPGWPSSSPTTSPMTTSTSAPTSPGGTVAPTTAAPTMAPPAAERRVYMTSFDQVYTSPVPPHTWAGPPGWVAVA